MLFEQGPIRPPSEAYSLLLRFTRNCPWNKCEFCPVYKGARFSRRSLNEILRDIDAVRFILDDLREKSWKQGYGGELTREFISNILKDSGIHEQYKHVAAWACRGRLSVFIQDANSLIMKTDDLVKAIQYLKEKIPGISRITTYGRASTIARKSIEELKELKDAGLSRIHVGMESGSDKVLKMVKKGITAKQLIISGQRTKEAGITLSEYIMPGLGGRELWKDHAVESARVLNEINPDFIRLRTLHIVPGTPLFEKYKKGEFKKLKEDEVVREIRLFIENLDGITSELTSDHIMNLLEEVEGKFPEDKEKMLGIIDEYLSLPNEDRILFRLGRRGGGLRSVKELKIPYVKERLKRVKEELESEEGMNIDKLIEEMGNQYI
ncbi:radical SAM protein [Desulfothermus okinawensis JCM 13304]